MVRLYEGGRCVLLEISCYDEWNRRFWQLSVRTVHSRHGFIAGLQSKVLHLFRSDLLWCCVNLFLFLFFYFRVQWMNFRLLPVDKNYYYRYQGRSKQYSSRHVERVDIAPCVVRYQGLRKEAIICQEMSLKDPWDLAFLPQRLTEFLQSLRYHSYFKNPGFLKQYSCREVLPFELFSLSRHFPLLSLLNTEVSKRKRDVRLQCFSIPRSFNIV